MSLSRETVLELMAFADGELDREATARAEKLLAESAEARHVVEAMRAPQIGAWLADSIAARTKLVDVDGIAQAVMAGVDALGEQASVVRIGDARARRAPRAQVTAAVVGAALALAAGVALYLHSDHSGSEQRAPVASVSAPSVDIQPPPVPPAAMAQGASPLTGVEVDEIDSPSRGVSVFEIPIGAAAAAANPTSPSSVVIWIEDDPGGK